jgi:hypothetical protein
MRKIAIIIGLLCAAINTTFAQGNAPSSCVPGSAFHHGEPGSRWTVDTSYNGWSFDIDSEESTLQTIPNDARSYVLIDLVAPSNHLLASIQCTYATNLKNTGAPDALINFDAFHVLPVTAVNMDVVKKNFQKKSNYYICHFPAGQPETCSWQ